MTSSGLNEIELKAGAWLRISDVVDAATIGSDRGADRHAAMTIPIPSGARVWLATGHTDMRNGFDGLALLVQETFKRHPL